MTTDYPLRPPDRPFGAYCSRAGCTTHSVYVLRPHAPHPSQSPPPSQPEPLIVSCRRHLQTQISEMMAAHNRAIVVQSNEV